MLSRWLLNIQVLRNLLFTLTHFVKCSQFNENIIAPDLKGTDYFLLPNLFLGHCA